MVWGVQRFGRMLHSCIDALQACWHQQCLRPNPQQCVRPNLQHLPGPSPPPPLQGSMGPDSEDEGEGGKKGKGKTRGGDGKVRGVAG